MAVKPIPDGYRSITPYLIVEGAGRLLEFVTKVFDAEVRFRMDNPDGTVGHAEFTIGDSVVMAADPPGEPMPGTLNLYVEDCDAVYQRALEAGATSVRELETQFYGDRSGGVKDPTGNVWWISTHVEDVSPEEMEKRAKEAGS